MNLHVSIAGNDVTALTLFQTTIEKNSSDAISTAELTFRRDYDSLSRYDDGVSRYGTARYGFRPVEMQEVVLTDDSATRQFAGYITAIERRNVQGNITDFVCQCSDYGLLLDRYTVNETYLNRSDQEIIVLAFSGLSDITVNPSNIATLVGDLGTFEAKDITLRELMERICELTGGEWRVDYTGNLRYYASGAIAAPFGLSDEPNGTTTFPHGITSLNRDFRAAANRITVLGGLTSGGAEITSTANSLESQGKYSRIISATVTDRNIFDQTGADLRAATELAQRAFPATTGTLKTYKDGLDVGQSITITNKPYGISQSFLIRSIRVSFIRGGDALDLGDGTEYRSEYDIGFGDKQSSLVSSLRRFERRTKPSTSIPVAIPPDLSVGADSLASTLTRFYLVSAMPVGTQWNQYPDDATFFNTTDRKIYRRTGPTSWTAEVPTIDLAGQITETQITDDSISTPKLQALAITAEKIAANSVIAGKIAADAVTAGTIAAAAIRAADAVFETGAIQTADIGDLTVTNAKIGNASITNAKIGNAEITGAKIAGGTITATNIQDATITGSKIAGGTITGSNISGSTITGGNIDNATITGAKIADSTITNAKISDLSATKINTGTLNAAVVTVTNLDAASITTGAFAADRITSGVISFNGNSLTLSGSGVTLGGAFAAFIVGSTSINAAQANINGTCIATRFDCKIGGTTFGGFTGDVSYTKPGGLTGVLSFKGGILNNAT